VRRLNSEFIKKQCAEGKTVAVYENGFITIKVEIKWKNHTGPLTLGGKAKFMITNVLAATLASYLWGFKTGDISQSLKLFLFPVQQTPGRMNIFEFKNSKFLLICTMHLDIKGVADYLESVTHQKNRNYSSVGDQ
jgi:cyanophycin synthetase